MTKQFPFYNKLVVVENEVEILKEFPYVLTVETYYDIMEDIENILRNNISQLHGKCEYPKCNIATIDKTGIKEFYKHCKEQNYSISESINEFMIGIKYSVGEYSYEHSHSGKWMYKYIKKTGYDFGICRYYFRDKNDIVRLVLKYISKDFVVI